LGIAPPSSVGDIMICMGASIGLAQGISKVVSEDTIAIIGDSTFFHAGIPRLINAVYNNHKFVTVVLDNLTTAMTGHQPHPGTGVTGMRTQTKKLLIEDVAKGCGVTYVKVVDPFKIKEAETALTEALRHQGPSLVVFRAPCALMAVKEKRSKGEKQKACRITNNCTGCMACVKLLGCPALIIEEEKPSIKQALCVGCGLCISVCPYKAIECFEV
ncbi:MAG: thiamine pyrophosphate-dependent enzyme, partial [Candidatus Bathyarchaeia archaeon]